MRLFKILSALALLAAAPSAVSGCADETPGAAGGTLQNTEYRSDHYCVRIVGARLNPRLQEKTREVALMMEKMFDIYNGLEEMPLPPGDAMPIWVHLSRFEYDRQAALHDYPPRTTHGFCNLDGEVHVFYRTGAPPSPEATLMHEGFHQYCHRAVHYPTPPEVIARVPNYTRNKLPTVPLWLNEGMAMNMETGRIVADHNGAAIAVDDVGAVNVDRLDALARLIRENRCPSVRGLMNKIMGDPLTTDDYAAMWGIVFDLRMATGNALYVREEKEVERAGPEAVRQAILSATDPTRPYPYLKWPVPLSGRFLRACRVAWGLDVPAVVEMAAAGAREPRDFDRQWNRAVTRAALNEFEKLLRDQGQTLEEWEQGWRKRMLALRAEVKGGSYRYVEPGDVRKARARLSRQDVRQGVW
ncbi:MAG: hypothetical protein LBT97_07660 [Planctomycetota bacterium]|jgi:hypothetical protein|nr:hypothetical protein [Planctomycetota bacterium]